MIKRKSPHKVSSTMSSLNDTEDLPWDPLWEYILGENEGKPKSRRRKKAKEEQGGLLSYLFPEEESRDDSSWHSSWQQSVSRNQAEKREEGILSSMRTSNGSNPSEPKAKGKKFWKRNKRQSQDESNAWEWKFDPAVAGSLSESTDKRERRVRFAKFNSSKAAKDEGPDYGLRFKEGTEIAAAELQKSQKSLLDWVGITDEDTLSTADVASGKGSKDNTQSKTLSRTLSQAKQPASAPPPETSSFPFAGLLNNWGDMSSSEDGSSLASTYESTQGSGTVTSTEETSVFTYDEEDEEDSKYTTDQSEASTFNPESEGEYNEVVLAFRPTAGEENNSNLLPILEETQLSRQRTTRVRRLPHRLLFAGRRRRTRRRRRRSA